MAELPTATVVEVVPTSDERSMAMLCHLLPIFTGFIGPLVIYLMKKDTSGYVRRNAAESLNFSISLIIYAIVSILLIIVIIGFFMLLSLGVFGLVCHIIATVKANEGKPWRYPLCIRMVS